MRIVVRGMGSKGPSAVNRSAVRLLLVILFLILSSIADGSQENTSFSLSPPDIAGSTFNGSLGNTSLSLPQPEKPASTLIAALDGTIYLVESASWKVIWSFPTGFPIYNSHRAPINDSNIAPEFIECGEDWELIIHDTHLGKTRFSEPIEFFMSVTPMECKDGTELLAYRHTFKYAVDAKTGRLHLSHGIIDYGPHGDPPEFLLKINRVDYYLKDYDPGSGRLLWTMQVSQLKAILYCPHHEDFTLDFALPYACGAEEYKDIYRHRQPYVFESLNHSRSPQPLKEINKSTEVGRNWVQWLIALFVTLFAVFFSIFYLCKSKGITQTNDSHPRKIGKLFLSTTEIGKGSHGTIVYEGSFERREVAVKRILKAHQESAVKEVDNLIRLEPHQNIVRYHGMESDQDFLYLALERCSFNLDYLIRTCKALRSPNSSNDQAATFEIFKKTNICLWKADWSLSDQLLDLMRDVVSGLAHLHKRRIVHRDLKPQNVLIMIEDQSLCAKLSDMGMSKQLTADKSSYSPTGCGSKGWQAPEVIDEQRQTQATDLFSLGCLIFFCVTGGAHPFGKSIERDKNIVKDKKKLFKVSSYPEVEDIIFRLLNPKPELRPKATKVLLHPVFWKSDKRLHFIRDVSERVENDRRSRTTAFLIAIEKLYQVVVDKKFVNWDTKIDQDLVNDLLSHKGYQFNSVSHLLRAIRNKESHYNELPQNLKGLLGSFPDGLDDYFASRFPKLFIEVYKTTYTHFKGDAYMKRYF